MDLKKVIDKLKNENIAEIKRQTGLSRQALYTFMDEKSMRLSNFEKLLETLHFEINLSEKPTATEIYQNLAYYGAPVDAKKVKSLEFEALISSAIVLSRSDGLVESVIPYILANQAKSINVTALLQACFKNETSKYLGFYADMANRYKKNRKLETITHLIFSLAEANDPWISLSLKRPSSSFVEIYMQNEFSKKWRIYSRGTFNDHLDRWKKWDLLQKAQ